MGHLKFQCLSRRGHDVDEFTVRRTSGNDLTTIFHNQRNGANEEGYNDLMFVIDLIDRNTWSDRYVVY